MSECEHAVIRGDLQGFLVLPNDLERRALRFESPVIPVYSSGQNYLTNMFATKEIRAVLSAAGSEMFTAQMYAKAESKSAQSGYVYFYIWHDATLYSDKWPDLKEADGLGYSLQRVDTKTMGYEASAWKADVPTLGK